MRLLLDTCTFLWLIGEPRLLSGPASEACTDGENELFLSAASAWEIAVKHSRGALMLPEPPLRFVPSQRKAHGIDALPVTEGASLRVNVLPHLHRDPFDRMLVAQSIEDGLILVSPDPVIHQYPVRTLW